MHLLLFPYLVFGTSTEIEVVWSVIILLGCGLAFTAYCVAYILILAKREINDVEVAQQGKERICEQQEAEPRECDCKEG